MLERDGQEEPIDLSMGLRVEVTGVGLESIANERREVEPGGR